MERQPILAILLLISLILLGTATAYTAGIQEYRVGQEEHPWIPWEPRPVTGVQRTLVLLVEFSDVKFRKSLADVEEMMEVVKNWFETSSYGRMTLDYTIYPEPITLPRAHSYYGAPEPGAQRGDSSRKIIEYYLTITDYVFRKTNIDFGEYNHVIVIHAGGDEAMTSNPNDIWSHCLCLGPAIKKLPEATLEQFAGILYLPTRDGGWHAIYGIETVSEEEDMNVMIHELTHSMGIADQYIYAKDGYSKGSEVGFWSNMDAGAFIGADIDGWSKYILGWIDAVEYTLPVDEEVEIYTLDSNGEPKALKINIPENDKEYYFIHARRRNLIDTQLPGDGVLVFKVNKMLPRTVEDSFMVKLYDANPGTPDCSQFEDNFGAWSVCVKLDAAYNTGRTYEWGRWVLNFENPRFWSDKDKFGVEVVSYDEDAGRFRLRLFGEQRAPKPETGEEGEEEGGGEVTVTTTTITVTETITTTVEGEARTVTTTQTVTITTTVTREVEAREERREEPGIDLWTILVAVIIVLMAAGFIVSMRRRRPPPPPPVMTAVCPVCGAQVYADSLYCWRCGKRLR